MDTNNCNPATSGIKTSKSGQNTPGYKLQKILNCAQNPLLQEAKKYSNMVNTPLVEGAKISKWYILGGGGANLIIT